MFLKILCFLCLRPDNTRFIWIYLFRRLKIRKLQSFHWHALTMMKYIGKKCNTLSVVRGALCTKACINFGGVMSEGMRDWALAHNNPLSYIAFLLLMLHKSVSVSRCGRNIIFPSHCSPVYGRWDLTTFKVTKMIWTVTLWETKISCSFLDYNSI